EHCYPLSGRVTCRPGIGRAIVTQGRRDMNSRSDTLGQPQWAQELNRGGVVGLTSPAPWELGDAARPRAARSLAIYPALRALPRRVRRALQRKLAHPLAGVALLLVDCSVNNSTNCFSTTICVSCGTRRRGVVDART